jgi:hypothetical protein
MIRQDIDALANQPGKCIRRGKMLIFYFKVNNEKEYAAVLFTIIIRRGFSLRAENKSPALHDTAADKNSRRVV